jgi:hypothetical protein
VLVRRNWLASFEDFPDACLTMFRFTFLEIQQTAVYLETELHTPRQSPVNGVALAYCRALTVNDSGIADGTLSKMRGALLPAFRLYNQQLPLYL